MMWVKLTLAPVVRASWLFKMRRLTSSSRAGRVRTLVAVGTPRLASMLAAIRDAAPRSTTACSSGISLTGVVAGAGAGAGAGTDGAGSGGSRRSRLDRRRHLCLRRGDGRRAVVRKELAPAVTHRRRIGQEPFVHV